MINSLPDEVLLEIFDLYRMDEVATLLWPFPWKWQRLVHVCRTWRSIIFSSSCHLNLELLCTYGTHVRKNLRYLPALPLVIYFSGEFGESDEDDIAAALEHPDRVRVVDLCGPCSLLEKMIRGPFLALTNLRLHAVSKGPTILDLPDVFLGGCAPHLQAISLFGIPFTASPTLLLSAQGLVDIGLHDTGYISPEVMVASLTALSRLKHLDLGFRWHSYPDRISQSPITQTLLPSLTSFYFQGRFKYLDDFVAQIDTPQLDCLRIVYLHEDEDVGFQNPQLCKFINRSEKFKLSRFRRADLVFPGCAVKLDGGPTFLKLSTQAEWITQGLRQISGMFSNVDRLFIRSNFPVDGLSHRIQWLEFLRLFTAVKALGVQKRLTDHVVLALKNDAEEMAPEILPALELLCLEHMPVESVKEFIAARRNKGRPVTFVDNKEFKRRLKPHVSEQDDLPYWYPTRL